MPREPRLWSVRVDAVNPYNAPLASFQERIWNPLTKNLQLEVEAMLHTQGAIRKNGYQGGTNI